MRRKIIILISALFTISFSSVLAKSTRNLIKEGNKLYSKKQYDEALQKYNEAEEKVLNRDILSFNKGTAYYKKGDYKEAIEYFTKALTTEDASLEARANYNIGNSKYRLGKLKETTELEEAVKLYREALAYYKRAIELNPKDKDAKFNHELVEKRLRLLLDNLKQNAQQQSAKSKKGKEGKQGKEGKRKKGSAKKEESQKARVEENKKKKVEEKKAKRKKEKVSAALKKEEKPKEMSEKEARMLLDNYREQEAMWGKKQQPYQQGYYPSVDKDW